MQTPYIHLNVVVFHWLYTWPFRACSSLLVLLSWWKQSYVFCSEELSKAWKNYPGVISRVSSFLWARPHTMAWSQDSSATAGLILDVLLKMSSSQVPLVCEGSIWNCWSHPFISQTLLIVFWQIFEGWNIFIPHSSLKKHKLVDKQRSKFVAFTFFKHFHAGALIFTQFVEMLQLVSVPFIGLMWAQYIEVWNKM